MKIGILTYHAVANFGANLQALSTVGFFRRKGYEPIIINWVPFDLEEKYKNSTPKIQLTAHKLFCEKHLPMTEICRSDDDIKNVIIKHDIDRLFIGSDALWNYYPLECRKVFSYRRLRYVNTPMSLDHDYPNPFWGCIDNSLKNIPMDAFSVSSQNMPFSLVKGRLKKDIGKSLLRFKRITVRDEWTKQLVEYFTDNQISPNVTPDPVFAFNDNITHIKTKEEILQKFNLPKKYVLISFQLSKMMNISWIKTFETLCKKSGYSCIEFPMPEKLISFGLQNKIDLPLDPLDWYCLIKYASGYVGERMHPIIVSLHNSVPFYSFDEYGLVKLGIISRWFPSKEEIYKSSKTYSILQHADFLDNYHSTKATLKLPAPHIVFDRLMQFDTKKCDVFAKNQSIKYHEAMSVLYSDSQ
jgi:hypothetical protein